MTKVLLGAMRNGPKHKAQFHGQVLIKCIYQSTVEVRGEEHKVVAVTVQRFVEPDHELVFPWNHWANDLGIAAWEFDQLNPVEAMPAGTFTGVFALSNVELETGHYWITFVVTCSLFRGSWLKEWSLCSVTASTRF
ncbi:hypothetical protein FRC08_000208 [Ceratobasidium sp. 394]|nr:hypothetical protein FRC08_000208 [Ceratobasidium sp. 394]